MRALPRPLLVALLLAAVLGGCARPTSTEPTPLPGTIATDSRVNLARVARLTLAEEVEVRAFSPESASVSDLVEVGSRGRVGRPEMSAKQEG